MANESRPLFVEPTIPESRPPFPVAPFPPFIEHTITRVDASGIFKVIKDKQSLMSRSYLKPHHLRLLDPLFAYPPAILVREKAIFVNIEHIRCVITAEEVLIAKSHEANTNQYEASLQMMLQAGAGTGGDVSGADLNNGSIGNNMFGHDYLPFEFRVLEVTLKAVCTTLDFQARELSLNEVYPMLDELLTDISPLNLERVRRSKSRLLEMTRRAQKIRDVIEQVTGDDGKLAEMYLTEKKRRLESSPSGDQSILTNRSKNDNTEELTMLLGVHTAVIDRTLNNLTSLKEYIDNSEVAINMKLDSDRNKFLRFELFVTTASFAIAIVGLVTGIFGMNFQIPLFQNRGAFKWVLIITGVCGAIVYCWLVCYFKIKIWLR